MNLVLLTAIGYLSIRVMQDYFIGHYEAESQYKHCNLRSNTIKHTDKQLFIIHKLQQFGRFIDADSLWLSVRAELKVSRAPVYRGFKPIGGSRNRRTHSMQ